MGPPMNAVTTPTSSTDGEHHQETSEHCSGRDEEPVIVSNEYPCDMGCNKSYESDGSHIADDGCGDEGYRDKTDDPQFVCIYSE